jgi:hypothetical protein
MNDMEELEFINSIERKLSESLQPVNPDLTFIYSLRNKLSQNSRVDIEKQSYLPGLVVLGLGLVSGALILVMMRKFKS